MSAIRLSLDVPPDTSPGQLVPVTLRVENVTGRPLELSLRGREIAFDVIVSDAAGIVWRKLEGEMIPAILQLKTLAPHETLELRAEWDQRTNRGRRVEPGLYSVRATLLTDDPIPLASPTVELEIR